jgi:hypothetical protein
MRPVACSASASNSPTVTLSCRLASSVRFACRKTRGRCFRSVDSGQTDTSRAARPVSTASGRPVSAPLMKRHGGLPRLQTELPHYIVMQGQASSNIPKGHPPSSIPIDLQIENCRMAACLLTLGHEGRTIQRWVVQVPWRTDVIDVGLLRKGKPDEYLRISHLYTETRYSSAS